MFGTALIVFREALEAALIIGIVSASTRDIPGRTRYVWAGVGLGILGSIVAASMALGGITGLAGGVALGFLVFAGLLRIPLKWFFSATSVLVLLLAAGMAAQSARFLIQADVLPSLATPLWDMSSVVANESAAGAVLKGLVGYDAAPAGMQVAFFVAVFAAILAGMAW